MDVFFARLPQCVLMKPARPEHRAVSPFAFAVLGMEMAGFTITGVLLDWLFGSMPWATVALTLLGVVAAFVHLAQMVRKKPPSGSEGGGP